MLTKQQITFENNSKNTSIKDRLTYYCCFTYRAMIEALQAENVDLKKNLGLATSRQNEIRDKLIVDKFEELLANQGKKNSDRNSQKYICVCV